MRKERYGRSRSGEGCVWENGDTLDANDVYYTWKMILDPKLANLRASNFANDAIEIVKAMDYFQVMPPGMRWA